MKKRWTYLFASMVLALFSGISYAWSVYQSPLMNILSSDLKSVSLAFTISVVVSTVAPVFLGRFQVALGVPRYLRLGILVYAIGLFSTIWDTNIYLPHERDQRSTHTCHSWSDLLPHPDTGLLSNP